MAGFYGDAWFRVKINFLFLRHDTDQVDTKIMEFLAMGFSLDSKMLTVAAGP